jgi:transposase
MGNTTHPIPRQVIMDIKAVGLDIGKSWFHFVGCNRAGKPIAHHKFNRGQFMLFIANLPPCLIGIRSPALPLEISR